MAQTLPARRPYRGGRGSVAVVIKGICALVTLCALVAAVAGGATFGVVRLLGALLG